MTSVGVIVLDEDWKVTKWRGALEVSKDDNASAAALAALGTEPIRR